MSEHIADTVRRLTAELAAEQKAANALAYELRKALREQGWSEWAIDDVIRRARTVLAETGGDNG